MSARCLTLSIDRGRGTALVGPNGSGEEHHPEDNCTSDRSPDRCRLPQRPGHKPTPTRPVLLDQLQHGEGAVRLTCIEDFVHRPRHDRLTLALAGSDEDRMVAESVAWLRDSIRLTDCIRGQGSIWVLPERPWGG